MSTYDTALALCEKLAANDVIATTDPRSVTLPGVLLTPPTLTYDLGCGATADWSVIALAPGPANADAWKALDELRAHIADVLPVQRCTFTSYSLSPDNPALPAYLLTYTESVETP